MSLTKGNVKKILFTVGSLNQTTQMHAIASHLPEYDCYFSQFYSDNPIIQYFVSKGIADHTILSGQFKEKADTYLRQYHLKNDYAQSVYKNRYDLAVVCSDLLVPVSIRQTKSIWVQEGMTDPITPLSRIVKALDLPRYWAMNTSLNGTSNLCDIYCVASEGYKEHFQKLGTKDSKLVVTGMSNFDNVAALAYNNFLHRNYVLVATSDIRECMGFENRVAFIRKTVATANGRTLIFKLHPNEKKERAIREIKENTPPGTLIYTDGNINHMIYHCDELITQYSTVVYVGLALGKKVHSYFNMDELRKKTPIQNEGKSAAHIAEICRRYIEYPNSLSQFLKNELPSIEANYQKIAC
ncbi:MAG: hypothetical protein ACK5RG_07315 [Cyclobacteriaceae bacterium]|jgi:hypothetical protein|nr:hypothetical protein [Flammeovirgaceae bacterium]